MKELSGKSEMFYVLTGGSDGKESACNEGNLGSTPETGRFPGERNGNSLQNLCLEKSMDGVAWQATVHSVAKSQTCLRDIYPLSRMFCSFDAVLIS